MCDIFEVSDCICDKEQAHNEEGEMIEAEVHRAMADPAPEYLPPYQDPHGIDDSFVFE